MNRTKTLSVLVGLTLSVLLVATVAQAQSYQLIRVDVPFDFWVQKTHMPAGQYMLTAESANVLSVRDFDRKASILTIVSRDENPTSRDSEASGKLVFTQHAGDYYLREVWSSGNNVGRILQIPKFEKTRMAGGKIPADQSVVVAALP